jgi:lysine/ornithine N-monooxygenase
MVEKERLLNDVRIAYEVDDEKIIEKIYDEFYGKEDKGNV